MWIDGPRPQGRLINQNIKTWETTPNFVYGSDQQTLWLSHLKNELNQAYLVESRPILSILIDNKQNSQEA